MLSSPSHQYTAAGVYTVTLSVSGPGGSDSEIKPSHIAVSHPHRCSNFTASPISGVAPLTVDFTNGSTGVFTSVLWDFGDGETSTLDSPSHQYTVAGVYTVTLSVSGPGGSDSEIKISHITVYAPQADFSASPVSGAAPLTVTFSDLSSGTFTSWLWDFGDGVTSTLQSPSHTYTSTGVYTVTLSVSGPGGSDQEIKVGYIFVQNLLYLPAIWK